MSNDCSNHSQHLIRIKIELLSCRRNLIELEQKLSQLQMQLGDRERELNASNAKICELTKRSNQLDLDVQRYKHERDTARKELEAEKELCTKLDIEIEKLHAEVHEYSEIRQEVSLFYSQNKITAIQNEIQSIFVFTSWRGKLRNCVVNCLC